MAALPILVLNGGSSSIKFSLHDAGAGLALLYEGEISGIGTPEARFAFSSMLDEQRAAPTPKDLLTSFRDGVRAIADVLDRPQIPRPIAVGHRVVHSGPTLRAHQRITPHVLELIEQASSFAPLHQPIALEIIHQAMQHFPETPHYACFDTVFHQDLPEVASIYPLPRKIRDRGVHRYGFHGLSCESILQQFREGVSSSPAAVVPARLIIAHLGSGASVTAVQNGTSLDTTMGLTPCGGVPMGTRPGDLDPGVVFYLLRTHAASNNATDEVENLLNKQSGLLALSDLSNDMRILRAAAASGNSQAQLAIDVFILGVKKSIGGFVAAMGGLDALVFTAGIGEHDALTRAAICSGLDVFGIQIDPRRNESAQSGAPPISVEDSHVPVYVLPAQEDRIIAMHVAHMATAH